MRFRLRIYRPESGISNVEVEAADALGARQLAMAQGGAVLSVRAAGLAWARGARFDTCLFCHELVALLEAGIVLVEAIDILATKSKDSRHQQVLKEVQRSLQEGCSLSVAIEAQSGVFSALLVATVRSSEQTGQLPEAIRRYLDYRAQLTFVRDKVIGAAVYPALLLVVGSLVVMFLLVYVVPRFSRIYEDVGHAELPILSQWLMQFGLWIGDHLGLVGLMVLGSSAATLALMTRPATRTWFTTQLWGLPRVGHYIRVYQLAQFTRTIAMLLNGGVPLVRALDMTAQLLHMPGLSVALVKARQSIAEGRSISDTFREHGLATEVGGRLLVVGERSGELASVLDRMAKFYDDEISRVVDWASRLFEPVLMVFIGVVIGGIVILMYLPIFELAATIQ